MHYIVNDMMRVIVEQLDEVLLVESLYSEYTEVEVVSSEHDQTVYAAKVVITNDEDEVVETLYYHISEGKIYGHIATKTESGKDIGTSLEEVTSHVLKLAAV